jgi:hypothetical protein
VRIRTIKPSFFKNDDLGELDPLARILFIGLWCMADRRGRLEDRPKRIKAELLPYDDADLNFLLNGLVTRGFITRYQVGELRIIQIASFEKHQRITGGEADTDSVLPEQQAEQSAEAPANNSGSTEETTVKHPGIIGATVRTTGREGKGKEGKGEYLPSTGVDDEEGGDDSSDQVDDPEADPDEPAGKKPKPHPSDEAFRFADWFRTLLPAGTRLHTGWREQWGRAYDELIRLDHRTPELITAVCRWAREDEFWSSNFLSPVKLRKRDKDGVSYFDKFSGKLNGRGVSTVWTEKTRF